SAPGGSPGRGAGWRALAARGGRVLAGPGGGRGARVARSRRLARQSAGVVAFLWGPSRGSVYTVREAIRVGKPAAVVLAGGGAVLPAFGRGRWAACRLGGGGAVRGGAGPGGPGPGRRSRRRWNRNRAGDRGSGACSRCRKASPRTASSSTSPR